jgi:ABC-type protease/lipase transport system fused ATPase/permease subunit
MGQKPPVILLIIFTALISALAGVCSAENSMMLGLCQELVNNARSYEQRAASHANTARNIMSQIENTAKQEKTEHTMAAMDHLFQQYDQHRAMERKYRELYKKAADQAKQCMRSIQ